MPWRLLPLLLAAPRALATPTLLPQALEADSSGLSELYVFATFEAGPAGTYEGLHLPEGFGEGLHLMVSTDGTAWQTLSNDPIELAAGKVGTVFRDPSITWNDGWFHLVFTTEVCAGIAKLEWDCSAAGRAKTASKMSCLWSARSADLAALYSRTFDNCFV